MVSSRALITSGTLAAQTAELRSPDACSARHHLIATPSIMKFT
ncbi:hypothetical protein [Micromonospora sp. NPDC005203]